MVNIMSDFSELGEYQYQSLSGTSPGLKIRLYFQFGFGAPSRHGWKRDESRQDLGVRP